MNAAPLARVYLAPMPDQPDPGCQDATRYFVVRDAVTEAGQPLLGVPLSPPLLSLAVAKAELEVHRTVWPGARIQRHVRHVFQERAPA